MITSEKAWEDYNNLCNSLREEIANIAKFKLHLNLFDTSYLFKDNGKNVLPFYNDDTSIIVGISIMDNVVFILLDSPDEQTIPVDIISQKINIVDLLNILSELEK